MCSEANCGGKLRVTHTYPPYKGQKFQRAVCERCNGIFCVASQATLVRARGEGAKAHAARVRRSPCDEPSSASY